VTERRQRATSVRLSPIGDSLWEELSERLGIGKNAVLEIAIRKYAAAEGLPVETKAKATE